MTSTSKQLENIFSSEISRLHEKANKSGLSVDDIKQLETLTRAWKTYNSTEVKKEEENAPEANLTTEELLSLAREENKKNKT